MEIPVKVEACCGGVPQQAKLTTISDSIGTDAIARTYRQRRRSDPISLTDRADGYF